MAAELPAWMSGKAQKRTQNRRSARHERQVAREVGGKVQAGSGTSWRARGDVKTDTYLIEHKYTDKRSFSVTRKIINQVRQDAQRQGKDWCIIIHFDGIEGEQQEAVVVTSYLEPS